MSQTARRWWRIGLLSVAFIFLGWLFLQAQHGLTPFIVGLVLAFLLMPLVDTLNRFMPRWLAIILVYILLIGAIVTFVIYLVPIIVDQSIKFFENSPTYFNQAQQLLTDLYKEMEKNLPKEILQPVNESLNNFSRTATNFVTEQAQNLVVTLRDLIFGTISFVIGVLIVPFWLFFVLKDKAAGMRLFYNITPTHLREDAYRLVGIISHGLNDYVRGQLLVASTLAVLVTIGLLIVGFAAPTAIFLGFIAGLFEVLPIIGPILGAIPSIVVALFTGQVPNFDLAVKVLIVFMIVQQIEGNILVPKIAGDSTKLHPAVVMVVIIVGSEIGGLPGAIISVPFAAVARDVYVYLYQRTVLAASPEEAEAKTPGRRDAIEAERRKREQRQLKSVAPVAAPLSRATTTPSTTPVVNRPPDVTNPEVRGQG